MSRFLHWLYPWEFMGARMEWREILAMLAGLFLVRLDAHDHWASWTVVGLLEFVPGLMLIGWALRGGAR